MLNIVLFRPLIPANTGNIMRTTMAINAKLHIIGPLPYTLDEKSLKRAGMDYISRLPFEYYEDFDAFNSRHHNKDIYYVTRYANKSYTHFDYSDISHEYYLMFGSEDTGIPHDILKSHKEKLLRIPMVANARSLNLSNSVAIVAYEVLRQQSFFNLSDHEVLKIDPLELED